MSRASKMRRRSIILSQGLDRVGTQGECADARGYSQEKDDRRMSRWRGDAADYAIMHECRL